MDDKGGWKGGKKFMELLSHWIYLILPRIGIHVNQEKVLGLFRFISVCWCTCLPGWLFYRWCYLDALITDVYRIQVSALISVYRRQKSNSFNVYFTLQMSRWRWQHCVIFENTGTRFTSALTISMSKHLHNTSPRCFVYIRVAAQSPHLPWALWSESLCKHWHFPVTPFLTDKMSTNIWSSFTKCLDKIKIKLCQ